MRDGQGNQPQSNHPHPPTPSSIPAPIQPYQPPAPQSQPILPPPPSSPPYQPFEPPAHSSSQNQPLLPPAPSAPQDQFIPFAPDQHTLAPSTDLSGGTLSDPFDQLTSKEIIETCKTTRGADNRHQPETDGLSIDTNLFQKPPELRPQFGAQELILAVEAYQAHFTGNLAETNRLLVELDNQHAQISGPEGGILPSPLTIEGVSALALYAAQQAETRRELSVIHTILGEFNIAVCPRPHGAVNGMLNYQRAMDIDPQHTIPVLDFANYCSFSSLYDKATQKCHDALQIDPKSGSAYRILSIVAHNRGNRKLSDQYREEATKPGMNHQKSYLAHIFNYVSLNT